MKFHIREGAKFGFPKQVSYENEDVRIIIGEISIWKGLWEFHHTASTCLLKDSAMTELKVFLRPHIDDLNAVIKVTARLQG